jgi:hypothetical protein
LHLVVAFLEQWLAVVERWGRWSRKHVGSPEHYILIYKSKWNEWQPTCCFNSGWILLHIGALRIPTGGSNSPGICIKSVCCWLCHYRNTSWSMTADISCSIHIKMTFFDWQNFWWCCLKTSPGSYTDHTLTIKS